MNPELSTSLVIGRVCLFVDLLIIVSWPVTDLCEENSGGSTPYPEGLSNNPYPFLVLIPISLRSILILSSHLRLGLTKRFLPIGLPIQILTAFLPFSFWLHALTILIYI